MFTLKVVILLSIVSSAFSASFDGWTRHVVDNSSQGADGARLADMNADGRVDVVTGWEEGGLIRAYLNPGRDKVKQQWPRVTVGKVGSPEDAVAVDLDGDGRVDVVSACEGKTQVIHFHWAPAEGQSILEETAWVTQPVSTTRGRHWMFCLPMDVDGENGTDLVIGSKLDNGMIGWLESPTNARDVNAWKLHKIRDAGWVMSMFHWDLDKDGDLDVVASDRRGKRSGVFWLENPGEQGNREGKEWKEHAIGAAGREVMFIDFIDLDGDSRKDVVATVKPTDLFWMTQGWSPFGRWNSRVVTMDAKPIGSAKGVAVGDLTLDGRIEIVLSFEDASGEKSGVVWTEIPSGARIEGAALKSISGQPGTKFDLVQLLDVDVDGDLDVLTCEEAEQLGVIWYENPTR